MQNKNMFRSAAIASLFTLAVVSTTGFVGKNNYIGNKLETIEEVLKNHYVGEIDEEKLEEGIYKGFVAGVGDTYTAYYTEEEFKELREQSSGVYAGIGIMMTLQVQDNSIEVAEIFEGSPAEKVGMKINDRIIEAGGQRITGDDFSDLPKIIKGTPGTTVDVTVYRPEENKNYEFTLERANVTSPTIYHRMIDSEIGYIQITQFEEVTYDQFKEALEEIKSLGAKGLVLDVRNNPGGLLDIVEQIADELVPKGVVVSTKDRNGKGTEYIADDKYTDMPVVVLINENSASASEVLSGALKDYNRAELVGTTTFGKGVVQSLVPLSDGSAIKLTTSQYFTPSGVCIQGIGIDPDYEVKLSTEKLLKGRDLTEAEDDQLQKAIEVIKGKIK